MTYQERKRFIEERRAEEARGFVPSTRQKMHLSGALKNKSGPRWVHIKAKGGYSV